MRNAQFINNLFIINRGYGKFALTKDLKKRAKCPQCKSSEILVRNIGFVKSEWKMQGILKTGVDNKVNSSGKSYDKKLYTFKEMDYQADWVELKMEVSPTEPLPSVKTESDNFTIHESAKDSKKESHKEVNKETSKKSKKTSKKAELAEKDQEDPIEDICDAPSSRMQEG